MLSTLDKCLHKQCKSPNSICFKAFALRQQCLHLPLSCSFIVSHHLAFLYPPVFSSPFARICWFYCVALCVCVCPCLSLSGSLAVSLACSLCLSRSRSLCLSRSRSDILSLSTHPHTYTNTQILVRAKPTTACTGHVHGMYTACS